MLQFLGSLFHMMKRHLIRNNMQIEICKDKEEH